MASEVKNSESNSLTWGLPLAGISQTREQQPEQHLLPVAGRPKECRAGKIPKPTRCRVGDYMLCVGVVEQALVSKTHALHDVASLVVTHAIPGLRLIRP